MRADEQRTTEPAGSAITGTEGDTATDVDALIVSLIGHLSEADSLEVLVGPIARMRRHCVLVWVPVLG